MKSDIVFENMKGLKWIFGDEIISISSQFHLTEIPDSVKLATDHYVRGPFRNTKVWQIKVPTTVTVMK